MVMNLLLHSMRILGLRGQDLRKKKSNALVAKLHYNEI